MLTLEEKLTILLDAAEEAANRYVAFRTLHEEFKLMGSEYRKAEFSAWVIMMDASTVENWLSNAASDLHKVESGVKFGTTQWSEMLHKRTQEILRIKINCAESFS